MKPKLLSILCTLMVFVPWTILPLRAFDWALQSPTAEIMIAVYAVFMIFSGIFTTFSYKKVQNGPMKAALVINGLYGVFGVFVLISMAISNF